MKRSIIVFIVVLLIYPSVAQALYMQGPTRRYALNDDNQDLGEIFVSMNDASLPITKNHGLTLILSATQWSLWEKGVITLQASGNAVERGKIAQNPGIIYSNDLKSVTIAVLQDFAVGDEVTLTGLKVKVYDRASGYQFVAVDINGDGVTDYDSPIQIKIDENQEKTDRVPPFTPPDFVAQVKENPWRVELSWQAPLDYDFKFFDLEKTMGDTTVFLFESSGLDLKYTDSDVHEYQNITYTLYAKDRRNRSEPVIQKVVIAKPVSESPNNTPAVIPSSPFVIPSGANEGSEVEGSEADSSTDARNDRGLSEEERSLLNKLLNYYRIRYQIKCLPSGRTVSAGDSACLWAKIDLVYAQERLDRSGVAAALSAQDTSFIGKRLPYSEDRYQSQCVGSPSPARFCSNLERAIDRANYFLDK